MPVTRRKTGRGAPGHCARRLRVSRASDADKTRRRVHRIFSDFKVWALSVYHGLRRRHLQFYLDEFVYRFDRRRDRRAAFPALFSLAAAHQPVTYDTLISLGANA